MRPLKALLALLVTVAGVLVQPPPVPSQEVFDRSGVKIGEIRRNRAGVYELYDDRGDVIGIRKFSQRERQMEFVDREGQAIRLEDGFVDEERERFFDVDRGRWRDIDEMEKPRRPEEPPPPAGLLPEQ
jgi:hypothetical protein